MEFSVDPGFSKSRTKAQKGQITLKTDQHKEMKRIPEMNRKSMEYTIKYQEPETQSTEESKVNSEESLRTALRTAHDDFLVYLTLVVINSCKITFTH